MKKPTVPQELLIRRNQPKPFYYDYDGLTGVWLWFPWWSYVLSALAVWPIAFWLLPHVNLQLGDWRIIFSTALIIRVCQVTSIFFIFSALASVYKAYTVRQKTRHSVPLSVDKPVHKAMDNSNDKIMANPKTVDIPKAKKSKTIKTITTAQPAKTQRKTRTQKSKPLSQTAQKPVTETKTKKNSTHSKPTVKKPRRSSTRSSQKPTDQSSRQLALDLTQQPHEN